MLTLAYLSVYIAMQVCFQMNRGEISPQINE
uniref:Bestrophin homolog n=1 Tax=Heterorhabditis bacteriophora TaxID=37862 RepID=A0A1I7WSV4_HETBA